MAKSIRSKWKRKCRAIKRERYSKKELERLKKTLGIDGSKEDSKDVNMTDINEIATMKTSKQIKEKIQRRAEEGDMETDQPKKVYNPKTLRDENGAHPVWLHPRKYIRKNKKEKKKAAKMKRKSGKK